MAEKLSKSILGGLKKMLHRAPEKPTKSAPKKPAASKEGARKKAPSPSPASSSPDQAGAPETQESTVVPASPALVAGSQTASKALSLSDAANPWKTSCTLLQLFSAFIRSSQRFTLGYAE